MNSKTSLALTVGMVVATGAALTATDANANPFSAAQMSGGYQLDSADPTQTQEHQEAKGKKEGKCGEGKCGEAKAKKEGEGKCGEGKCGEAKAKKEGEGKCGEGKCGEAKAKKEGEGKCGEGKCGSH